ncbi:MAG: lipid-binding SYLF domain-containing protein [Acaryochloridaceae cyanobacterium SU_2_1]|nr:lipid-binding SYLF domain-containing protein [Acaryochloridaceae cyanobacterium SU_2_1]
MKRSAMTVIPITVLLLVTSNLPIMAASDVQKQAKAEKIIIEASDVLEDILSDPKTQIPPDLLQQSEGIAIIPDVIQAGFLFGGRGGTGIIMLRQDDGSWSNPAFVNITGGSFGLQIGAKSSDVILVFPNRDTVNEVLSKSFDLGGSVTGTAGPVGSTPVDPTKDYSKSPILTYSRSRGLFGGVTIDGSKIGFNRNRNRDLYGRSVTPRRIFRDPNLEAPVVVDSLRQILEESEEGTYSRY